MSDLDPMETDPLASSYAVPDRATFVKVVAALARNRDQERDTWGEVDDIADYLQAIAFWTNNQLDQFNKNVRGKPTPEPPDWQTFADILRAARVVGT